MTPWEALQSTHTRLLKQQAVVEAARKDLTDAQRELTARQISFETARKKLYEAHPELEEAT